MTDDITFKAKIKAISPLGKGSKPEKTCVLLESEEMFNSFENHSKWFDVSDKINPLTIKKGSSGMVKISLENEIIELKMEYSGESNFKKFYPRKTQSYTQDYANVETQWAINAAMKQIEMHNNISDKKITPDEDAIENLALVMLKMRENIKRNFKNVTKES